MNDFDNENKTAGNPYSAEPLNEKPIESPNCVNEPQNPADDSQSGGATQNDVTTPQNDLAMQQNGADEYQNGGYSESYDVKNENDGNGYYSENGYYVHKSNGYIPPETKSSGYESSYNQSENPYDRQNGVFTGGGLPEQKGGNGLGITSMVLGIISVILCCCGSYVTLIIAIAGLACGIVALTKRSSGFAIAGVITSAVGIIFGIIGIIIGFNSSDITDWLDTWGSWDDSLPEQPAPDSSFDHNNHAFLSNLKFYIKLFLGV